MGLLTQAAYIFGFLATVLGIAVIAVAFTRARRFRELQYYPRFHSTQIDSTRINPVFAYEIKRLPDWLRPLVEYETTCNAPYNIFDILIRYPLELARGQLLMAFLGSLMALVGILLLNTSLVLFEAVGILSAVLGFQVIAGAIRQRPLFDRESTVEAEQGAELPADAPDRELTVEPQKVAETQADAEAGLGEVERGALRAIHSSIEPGADDRVIRERLLNELKGQEWAEIGAADIMVRDRIVHIWGTDDRSSEARRALLVVAENIPGVRRVEEHFVPGPVRPQF